jgi:guanine deaminase
MCLGAILWARIKRVYFGCIRKDAARIGFDDRLFYDVIAGRRLKILRRSLLRDECLALFEAWRKKPDKVFY